eukprot:16215664-Heterocapsa_arctica.AAC.1
MKKKDPGAFYMMNSMGVYVVRQLKEFIDKKLKSIAKNALNIENKDEEKKLGDLKEVLGDKVDKVMLSGHVMNELKKK